MMAPRVLLLPLLLLSLVLAACASGPGTPQQPTAGMQLQPQPSPAAQPQPQQPTATSSGSAASSTATTTAAAPAPTSADKIAAARATLATVSALWESLADAVEQIGEPWRRRGHDGLLDTLEALGGWRERLAKAIADAEATTADTAAADTAAGAARDPNVQAVIDDAEAALADLEALTRGSRR